MNFVRQKIIDTYSRGGEEIPHSAYAVIPRFTIFALYLIILELFYAWFPETMSYIVQKFTLGIFFLSFVCFVAFVLRPYFTLFNSYHEIGVDNLISVQGFISPFRREYLCPYTFINGVEIRQNLFERLTDMGSLLIGTSMTGKAEIVLKHIQRPEYYAKLLQDRISESED
jgi:membrane protein YdbS with pleckstrin-like domain